ncbi:MAG: fasciclin domain-containing protein [Bacteroidota bacterium]
MKFVISSSRILAFSFIMALSVTMISCSKDDMNVQKVESKSNVEIAGRRGAPAPGSSSIAQIAINAGFSELVAALTYVDGELNTGLVNLFLNGKDQYTVFAPTNAAFQNLYTALNITKISNLPAPLVKDVLLYHVVEGRRASNSVLPKSGEKTITTLLNANFTVNAQGKITAIGNTANIVTANISASNGIIHVIDAVILPIK